MRLTIGVRLRLKNVLCPTVAMWRGLVNYRDRMGGRGLGAAYAHAYTRYLTATGAKSTQ